MIDWSPESDMSFVHEVTNTIVWETGRKGRMMSYIAEFSGLDKYVGVWLRTMIRAEVLMASSIVCVMCVCVSLCMCGVHTWCVCVVCVWCVHGVYVRGVCMCVVCVCVWCVYVRGVCMCVVCVWLTLYIPVTNGTGVCVCVCVCVCVYS